MVLGKKVAIFDWEWGRNSAPREGQKIPWMFASMIKLVCRVHLNIIYSRHNNQKTFSGQKILAG